ncbi:MAG: DUF1697 domain-containing protein [Sedimentisphaerales bacterium]|nr:DUF1697 domain-containing protein [Sedimentisphaerales bacterium]
MKTYGALFRGINITGRNLLPMKELVSLLEALGCRNVRTYIQSGNAVFRSDERDATPLARRIVAEIQKRRGFNPRVLLLGVDELEKAITGNPFPDAESEPGKLHVGFLVAVPPDPDLNKLEALRSRGERFALKGTVFYLHTPEGYGKSKLAASAERLLGVPMTDRNWRTVCKIREMVKELK